MKTPLAVFVYNRPRHAERLLQALGGCERLGDVDVVIFSDAPRSEAQAEAVDATRTVAQRWAAAHRAEVVARDRNLGLARSIAGSVGALTEAAGRVIVLEDDLVPSPDFLSFALAGLDRYEDDERVVQVAGHLLIDAWPGSDAGFFLPLTTTWGWATWRRAWQSLFPAEADIDTQLPRRDAEFRRRFTLGGAGDAYLQMLDDRLAGRNDSWGILWWYAVARAGALVLYPRRSLVWNGGFDGSGVHSGGSAAFSALAPERCRGARLETPLRLPTQVATDEQALAAVAAFLGGGVNAPVPARLPARLWSGLRKLRSGGR